MRRQRQGQPEGLRQYSLAATPQEQGHPTQRVSALKGRYNEPGGLAMPRSLWLRKFGTEYDERYVWGRAGGPLCHAPSGRMLSFGWLCSWDAVPGYTVRALRAARASARLRNCLETDLP